MCHLYCRLKYPTSALFAGEGQMLMYVAGPVISWIHDRIYHQRLNRQLHSISKLFKRWPCCLHSQWNAKLPTKVATQSVRFFFFPLHVGYPSHWFRKMCGQIVLQRIPSIVTSSLKLCLCVTAARIPDEQGHRLYLWIYWTARKLSCSVVMRSQNLVGEPAWSLHSKL